MPTKNSNDTIGNRTRNFLACSAVPQPTAPPRAWLVIELLMSQRLTHSLTHTVRCHMAKLLVKSEYGKTRKEGGAASLVPEFTRKDSTKSQ
jgi:hypothetical protein